VGAARRFCGPPNHKGRRHSKTESALAAHASSAGKPPTTAAEERQILVDAVRSPGGQHGCAGIRRRTERGPNRAPGWQAGRAIRARLGGSKLRGAKRRALRNGSAPAAGRRLLAARATAGPKGRSARDVARGAAIVAVQARIFFKRRPGGRGTREHLGQCDPVAGRGFWRKHEPAHKLQAKFVLLETAAARHSDWTTSIRAGEARSTRGSSRSTPTSSAWAAS